MIGVGYRQLQVPVLEVYDLSRTGDKGEFLPLMKMTHSSCRNHWWSYESSSASYRNSPLLDPGFSPLRLEQEMKNPGSRNGNISGSQLIEDKKYGNR